MPRSTLPADAPLWRRHLHADGYGYGWLLIFILATIGFQLAVPDDEWARVVTIGLQSVTVLASLRAAGAHRFLVRFAVVVTLFAVLGTTGVLVGTGALGAGGGRAMALLLVLVAPAAIALGVVRQARATHAITVRTMFGVLCIYLLVGSAFAYAFGIVGEVQSGAFFAQGIYGNQSDYLYFSFATMTTTGYGDLTAASDLGRSLAILEALIGQIYLVTVVALIVGTIGARGVAVRR